MLRENLQDAAVIIQNILDQPLEVKGKKDGVSLYTAALNYDSQNPSESDLFLILKSFIDYPDPTQTLLRELELLSNDLTL